jgi:hypothetical protein
MKRLLFIALILLCTLFSASAQWSDNPSVNNPINTMAGEQAIPKIATCSNGDSYIASFSNESGNYNVRMQRLDVQGNPLWATNGILISNQPQMTWLTDWDMTADNANHAILTWQDIRNGGNNNVVAYRISPSGDFVWGADGIALSNSTAFNASPKVTVTSAGNAVFAWQADDVIIIQKVSPTGSLLWGPNGITLSSSATFSWPQLLPVGTDDVILKYFEDTGPPYSPTRHIYAQRYDADGNPVWSSAVEVSNAGGITAWEQILPFINDGSDGFYMAWHDQRYGPGSPPSIYVQHLNSDGQPQFTTNGVRASQSSYMLTDAQLALPPGSTDIYVYWNEIEPMYQNMWGICGQKISSGGSLLWGNNGKVIIPVNDTQRYLQAARNSSVDMMLVYDEYLDAVNIVILATRLDTDGNYVWPSQTNYITTVQSEKMHYDVNNFADNQWIVAWEDNRNGNYDIYAQNIQLSGELGPVQFGTIEGTVTLNGGSGDVTQALVTAGEQSVNPDATGFYSITILAGTYDVTASLISYYPDTVLSVVVVANQATTGVDLTLQPIPTGFISGNVVLNGGTGNVTDVTVIAGIHVTNPDAQGDYSMEVEIGNYDVTASLIDYTPETIPDVVVLEGQTTVGVDFILNLAPTTGFITGTVELQGSGDVTQVAVTAGDVTVNPDATGYYIMEITAGTWDVSASMAGYLTQVVSGVVVEIGLTTPGVDFYLLLAPENGYIAGYVTLVNGTGDVTETEVSAGDQVTHPTPNGHYFLSLMPGTYTVHASHPYTLPDSISGVIVEVGQTTDGVNFELEVVRGDLICRAKDTYNNVLNNVDVEIIGPEGTYTGTITDDSLLFENMPYGLYSGTAWMEGEPPVNSQAELGASNHEIIFVFDLTGIKDNPSLSSDNLRVYPNPMQDITTICYMVSNPAEATLTVYSRQGIVVRNLLEGWQAAGIHTIAWDGDDNNSKPLASGWYLIVLKTSTEISRIAVVKL